MFDFKQTRRAEYEGMSRGDLIDELCKRDAEVKCELAESGPMRETLAELARVQGAIVEARTMRDEYAQVFDLAPAPYCVHSHNGTIEKANAALAMLLCTPQPALVGMSLLHVISTPQRQLLVDHVYRTLERGRRLTTEIVGEIRGRGEVTLRVTSVPLERELGAVSRCATIVEDITRLKVEEDALRQVMRLHDDLARAEDEDGVLAVVTSSCIPRIADACFVELRTDDAATLRRTLVAPDKQGIDSLLEWQAEGHACHHLVSRVFESLSPAFEPSFTPGAPGPFILVPLVARGQALGVLGAVRGSRERPYALHDVETVLALADRAAMALANLRRA